ncbi:MAG: hypothetical protein GX946_09815 [Oligosphaeraceae bacterium]|jgi:hypothetical protein|nr:hypothetical protein [Oligosphaeraceae bacterium]
MKGNNRKERKDNRKERKERKERKAIGENDKTGRNPACRLIRQSNNPYKNFMLFVVKKS